MKLARKTFVLASGLLLTVSAFGYFFWYKPKFSCPSKNNAFAFTGKEVAGRKYKLLRSIKTVIPA